jgi:hypothetical protein
MIRVFPIFFPGDRFILSILIILYPECPEPPQPVPQQIDETNGGKVSSRGK